MGSPAQDSAPLTGERARSISRGELEALAAESGETETLAAAAATGRVFGVRICRQPAAARRSFPLILLLSVTLHAARIKTEAS